MTSFTTIEFANALIGDAERHWLYGHPYRSAAADRRLLRVRGTERLAAFAGLRGAGAFLGRRRLAA